MFNPKSLSGSRIIAIIFLSVFLTACSVADYKKPVGDFSAAANTMETTLTELNNQVTSAKQKIVVNRVLSGDRFVKYGENKHGKKDCQATSTRCRLELLDLQKNKELLTTEPALRNMLALARSLRAYANNLSAIVEADTATQVETSVNETIGSLGRIEDTVEKIGESSPKKAEKIEEYATPVGLLINWFVGQYVAKVKIDALKHATKNAKDIVAEAAEIFQKAVERTKDVQNRPWAEEVTKRLNNFRISKSEQDLNALIEAANKYDKFLTARSSNVFASFRTAHDALADKLQENKLSMGAIYAKISALLAEAEKLAAIVKAFS